MSDIIQLLPEAVANQIHAGEVVQRPSSVVKELIENAIDAGATQIKINIKDAGRTLIQVSDNGYGMSSTDARMAFELHATSKIREAADLFNIQTMGFRGEALAAISIVADVELRTKQAESECGTFIHIVGSEVKAHEPVQCALGTNFMIKNLFFNTSARRKFLKADKTELKHIVTEFQRLALANPAVGLSLMHNGDLLYELTVGDNLRKRILSVFGKGSNQKFIPIETNTSLANISGFVGQPKFAKKRYGEQFFFVNGRYMKHLYFHKAIMTAFEKLLPPGTNPSYFIFFEVNPSKIDVNVSPNKTEVKFENERDIWHILSACIRESLGKFNVMPSIDFDQIGSIDIPVAKKGSDEEVAMPQVTIDRTFNPFEHSPSTATTIGSKMNGGSSNSGAKARASAPQWDSLYQSFEQSTPAEPSVPEFTIETRQSAFNSPREEPVVETRPSAFNEVAKPESSIKPSTLNFQQAGTPVDRRSFQLKGKYIVSPIKSGLMVINQRRAHERILYEKYLAMFQNTDVASQQLLFPQRLELNAEESMILSSLEGELQRVGFQFEEQEKHVFQITAIPAIIDSNEPTQVLESMLSRFKDAEQDFRNQTIEVMAENLASASAIGYGKLLQPEEQHQLIDQLFACAIPNYTAGGKTVMSILSIDELEGMF
ncbi:MAG: DNA mismatch repair endonuclease MutL [Mangrovibacterium sp.]